MKRLVLCGAMASSLVLAGCASSGGGQVIDGQGDTAPAPQGPQQEQAGDTSGQQTLTFGDTHEGQISKTVRKLEPFELTTGPTAAPKQNAPAWGVEFEFTNNTSEPWSPVMFNIGARVDDRPAAEVFDGESGYDGLTAVSPVGPGETVKFPAAFLGEGEKHVVTIAPLDMRQSITYSD